MAVLIHSIQLGYSSQSCRSLERSWRTGWVDPLGDLAVHFHTRRKATLIVFAFPLHRLGRSVPIYYRPRFPVQDSRGIQVRQKRRANRQIKFKEQSSLTGQTVEKSSLIALYDLISPHSLYSDRANTSQYYCSSSPIPAYTKAYTASNPTPSYSISSPSVL